jgi:MFS family permease
VNTLLLRFVATASLARLTNEGLAIALVLIADERTGSTAQAGVLVAASTFPQLVSGPLLGPVVDRSPRPWALLRLAGVVTFGAAALLATTVGRTPLVVPLVGALAMAGVEPLLNGGVSAIAGRGAWSTRVFAWDSLAYNVAGLGGPAVVTAVAFLASPAWALVVLGVGAGAMALTSLGLAVADEPAAGSARPPGRRTIAAAVRLMATDPALRSATAASTLAFAALGGLSFALVAATAADGRRPTDAGVALTVSAVGGLAGSLAMTRRPALRRPELTVLATIAAMGVLLVAMGGGSWAVLLAGAFLMGVADGPLLVGLFATRTDRSPPALRATVFTVGASAKLGTAAVGALVAGVVLDGRATGAGLVAIGAVHLLAAALSWLSLRT